MPELTEIKGVGPVLAKACANNGYGSVKKIAAATLHDLVAVRGINETKAKLVIAAAQALLDSAPASPLEAIFAETAPEDVKAEKKKSKKKKDKKKAKKEKKKKNKAKKKGKKS
jgi:hypothetical protein